MTGVIQRDVVVMNPVSIIRSIDSVWETPFTDEVWEFLKEKQTDSNTTEETEILVFGPVLPDEMDPRVAILTVHCHREKDTTSASHSLHWNLGVMCAPETPAPDKVKEADRVLDGRRGLQKLIDHCITGILPIAMFRLQLSIPATEYRCKILPRVVVASGNHDIAAGLARTSRLEQVGYRFEGSEYGLEEVAIIYDHEDDAFVVKSLASRVLSIVSSKWCPYADEVTELLVKAFFAPVMNEGA